MGAGSCPEPPPPGPIFHLGPTGSASHTHLHDGSDLLPLLPQFLLIYLGVGRDTQRQMTAATREARPHPPLPASWRRTLNTTT